MQTLTFFTASQLHLPSRISSMNTLKLFVLEAFITQNIIWINLYVQNYFNGSLCPVILVSQRRVSFSLPGANQILKATLESPVRKSKEYKKYFGISWVPKKKNHQLSCSHVEIEVSDRHGVENWNIWVFRTLNNLVLENSN